MYPDSQSGIIIILVYISLTFHPSQSLNFYGEILLTYFHNLKFIKF